MGATRRRLEDLIGTSVLATELTTQHMDFFREVIILIASAETCDTLDVKRAWLTENREWVERLHQRSNEYDDVCIWEWQRVFNETYTASIAAGNSTHRGSADENTLSMGDLSFEDDTVPWSERQQGEKDWQWAFRLSTGNSIDVYENRPD